MTTNRYSNGKIYRLVNSVDDEFYVGSTCLPLHKRLYGHKGKAKSCPERKVYKHIVEVGWDNVSIVLVETYPCNNKDELLRRERYWIDRLQPKLNKQLPCRTVQEYTEERKDIITEYQVKYREENKEALAEKEAEYRAKNREIINEKAKQIYQKNKEELKEKARQYRAVNGEAINARRRELKAQKKAQLQAST